MATHVFAVGERVCLSVVTRDTRDSASVFIVKTLLPHVGTQLQYRVRAEAEPYDRVVTEGQLSRCAQGTGQSEAAAVTVSAGG